MNEPNKDPGPTADAPAPKIRTPGTAQKAEWVRKYLQSGLGLREFSRQHGLGYMSLHRWVSKQRETTESERKPPRGAMDFAELKLPLDSERSNWAAELTLPNGTRLRLSKDTPPTLVEQLLR